MLVRAEDAAEERIGSMLVLEDITSEKRVRSTMARSPASSSSTTSSPKKLSISVASDASKIGPAWISH